MLIGSCCDLNPIEHINCFYVSRQDVDVLDNKVRIKLKTYI